MSVLSVRPVKVLGRYSGAGGTESARAQQGWGVECGKRGVSGERQDRTVWQGSG